MDLLTPSKALLPDYVAALTRGWSPDNLRQEVAQEQLSEIHRDPEGFLAALDDREGRGAPVILPDGTKVARLPGFHRWIWQDGFCGTIGFRWQPGTEALPPHCLGHIGYAVVPWRRGQGMATAALMALLAEIPAFGLRHVEITCSPDNAASIRVVERAGGVLVERFVKLAAYGGGPSLRYRINLSPATR